MCIYSLWRLNQLVSNRCILQFPKLIKCQSSSWQYSNQYQLLNGSPHLIYLKLKLIDSLQKLIVSTYYWNFVFWFPLYCTFTFPTSFLQCFSGLTYFIYCRINSCYPNFSLVLHSMSTFSYNFGGKKSVPHFLDGFLKVELKFKIMIIHISVGIICGFSTTCK